LKFEIKEKKFIYVKKEFVIRKNLGKNRNKKSQSCVKKKNFKKNSSNYIFRKKRFHPIM